MSNRHLARTIAMQSLYQWDFLGQDDSRLPEIVAFNRNEFAPDFDDGGFVQELVDGTLARRGEIDGIITQFAPDWPIDTITIVDRNILRLGCYELKFSDAVPSKVAINEAIELAKSFGGEASGRFVNGVLGAVYKDMLAKGEIKEVDKNPPKKTSDEPKKEETAEPGEPEEST